jgi:hypothetical protein
MLVKLARSFPVTLLLSLLSLELVSALPTLESAPSLESRDGSVTVWTASSNPSPCHELDLDDIQSLPGWPKLEDYARSKWGDGDWTITINPPGYRDKRATMCVADPVMVNQTGPFNCTEERVYIPPERNGKHVKVDRGYMNVGNWSITNVTTAAHALFFSGQFQMPNISSESLMTITTRGEFINAPDNGFSTVASNKTIKDVGLTQITDKTCIGTILNRECIIPAAGRIRLTATGYIWFTYKTKRAPLDNPNGVKHKRYTVLIEDVLRNVTDRSAFIDFEGAMNTTWRYDYYDECRWNFKL